MLSFNSTDIIIGVVLSLGMYSVGLYAYKTNNLFLFRSAIF